MSCIVDVNQTPVIDRERALVLIKLALDEDLAELGDTTTQAVVDAEICCKAVLKCKADDMVLAGLPVAEMVFKQVDNQLIFSSLKQDGEICQKGNIIAEISGFARSILIAERTALNFLQRLSGVATAARNCVREVAGSGLTILDTRKTTPGYRNLEKYAVAMGGAMNHRMGLYDMVMIKDNHRELAAKQSGGEAIGIHDAVKRARKAYPDIKIEVEADTIAEMQEAIDAGADVVMLDNMSDAQMTEAVKIAAGRVKLEASGGITRERLPRIGKTGVNYVSLGALTHSVKSADISLDMLI